MLWKSQATAIAFVTALSPKEKKYVKHYLIKILSFFLSHLLFYYLLVIQTKRTVSYFHICCCQINCLSPRQYLQRFVVSGAILFSEVNPLSMWLSSYLWQTEKLIGRLCLYWYPFGSWGMLVEFFVLFCFIVLIHVVFAFSLDNRVIMRVWVKNPFYFNNFIAMQEKQN